MTAKKFSNDLVSKIKSGQVGVIPTDTLYGLTASAHNAPAVNKLYGLKKRDNKPGTIIAANIKQLVDLGIKKRYLKAVEHFWPNPISVVLPVGDKLEYLHLGKKSLAVRIPKDQELVNFLEKTGPLVTTSANVPGQSPSNDITESKKIFGDKVDFYVDGGDFSDRQPSTVIRIVDDVIEVLRQGVIKLSESGRILE